jgi:beta-ribofuranosylaminobenzene 5'-phosphate synthase
MPGGEVVAMDIAQQVKEIEAQVGRLSPVQKILIGTDGSVTQLLESVTGSEIVVRTQVQEIVPANRETAERLGVPEGEPVNYRVVDLIDNATGQVLVHACSHTPIARLSPDFRDDLMKADIPIGRIIKRHRIEARREILHARVSPASHEAGDLFSICAREPLLSRQYRIIHRGDPLIFIEEQFPYNRFLDERRVIVSTPSRIHITLIDMHGGSGRVDGGIGITLEEPANLLEARQSEDLAVSGVNGIVCDQITAVARHVLETIHAGGGVAITVREHVPAHLGLGSGTQRALAVARAVCECYGRTVTARELAFMVGRGGTSGIGTAAFENGGFIIDGGHRFGNGGEKTIFSPSGASRGVRPPPVIARHDFPADWRILLAIPDLPAGASGVKESDIFRVHCPVPLAEVQALCHEVLMRMLPGIAEHDLDLFGSSVNAVQHLGFKKVELHLQPDVVPLLMDELRQADAAGAGMSSFGPTVYAITDTDTRELERAAQSFMDAHGGGTTLITSARNSGAAVRVA